MKKQSTENQEQNRYELPEKFNETLGGTLVRSLMEIDLNMPYSKELNRNEQVCCAENIVTKIRNLRDYASKNNIVGLVGVVSGILNVDINDVEIKLNAVSHGLSIKDSIDSIIERYQYTSHFKYFRPYLDQR